MLPPIEDKQAFYKQYWNYYLVLEQDFLSVEPYVAIDPINFSTYSVQFLKLYQTICSEIDVVAKCLCNKLDTSSRPDNITGYQQCITSSLPDLSDSKVTVMNYDISLSPWNSWSSAEIQTPEWWKKYNKVKHNRTTISTNSGEQYYKSANLENVLNALAALFILEMNILKIIAEQTDSLKVWMPDPPSKLFQIEGWTSRCHPFTAESFVLEPTESRNE